MNPKKVVIVDGFSDLPFSIGTPPFMSPEVRYAAGACWERDDKIRTIYVTIEDLRAGRKSSLLEGADLVLVYAGLSEASPSVRPLGAEDGPGVAKVQDLVDYVAYLDCPKVLGGPYVLATGGAADESLGFDAVVTGDLSKYVHELLSEGGDIGDIDPGVQRNSEDLSRFAILGAGLAVQNPGYPYFLSCGVELYRGCPSAYLGGCSFCHETRYTTVEYRPVEDVVAEVAKLAELGCENIVFEAPCFFSYFSSPDEEGGLKLDPAAVERLLEGSRSVAPELKTLHVQNVNPAVLVQDEEASRKILKSMLSYCSDGNFPNLRVITFDGDVRLVNNTKATAEESVRAVEMMADAGRTTGPNGLPRLLATIELVYGLPGETEATLEANMTALKDLSSRGLIRGVVARRLVPLPGTTVFKRDDLKELQGLDDHLRALMKEVNLPSTAGLARPGQLIRDVFFYKSLDGSAVGKRVGVNPLSLVVHGVSRTDLLQDVRVTAADDGRLEAVVQPLSTKTVSREILRLVPEMTEERIDRFMRSRPERAEEFYELFEEPRAAERAASYFEFKSEG